VLKKITFKPIFKEYTIKIYLIQKIHVMSAINMEEYVEFDE
jgi:hypothetical protein